MPRHTEYQACKYLVEWWGFAHRSYGIPEGLLLHVPNQAGGNPRTGFHLKQMGVRKGCPDYLLLVPNKNGYHGLAIEMKSSDGKLSKEQEEFAENLVTQNYMHTVCRSSSEAREAIEEYLKR